MSRKILVTMTLGLALLFAVVRFASPLQVQSQPAPKALQDTTTYPGPQVVNPDPGEASQSYPGPQSSNGSVSMIALVLVAVLVVVFVIAVWLVNRLRRKGEG